MTYDTLLALRGWGESDFRLVRPDFLQAVRFALFAERMAPELTAARTARDLPLAGLPPAEKASAFKAKTDAVSQIAALEPLLIPDGD